MGRDPGGLAVDGRELIRTRLTDLDRMAYERGILRCSGFLSYAEQSEYHQMDRSGMFRTSVHFLDGGYEDAERAAAFFLPDYMEREDAAASEIAAIKASAVNDRFADELTHRDYLGALMNLGIERDCIGDILTEGSSSVFFCSMEMADYITENLLRVKHTSVRCSKADRNALNIRQELEELQVNVASERIDAVIAALYRISRQKAAQLIEAEHVFINGIAVTSAGKQMKEGDRISVRGHGKFIYDGVGGSSRKGRLYVSLRRFV